MSSLDESTIRHALKTAQENGFHYVKLKVGNVLFKANISDSIHQDKDFVEFEEEHSSKDPILAQPQEIKINAPVVGYYKQLDPGLKIGIQVKKGDIIAQIVALGLSNDVLAPVDGEVIEIFVTDAQPIEFKQCLAKIKGLS